MTSLTKTFEKPTKGDKVTGLCIWGALLLLSIFLVCATDLIIPGLILGGLSLILFVALIKELHGMRVSLTDAYANIDDDFFDLSELPEILYFKSAEAAFEYSKMYLKHVDDWSVGIVLNTAEKNNSGMNEYRVKILNHKSKIMTVTALQLERIKKPLMVGDFVAVIAIPYSDVPVSMNIKTTAEVVLFIHSKLKPEYSMKESAWAIEAS